jgi:hypothetical protein
MEEAEPPVSSNQPSGLAEPSETPDPSVQETTTCSILTDGEWVDISCDDLNAGSEQDAENNGNRGSVTPNPKPNTGTPVQTPNPGSTSGSNNQQPVTYCPDTREENPAVYDACRAGFVAPTKFEWARYHSCERLSDTKVKLVGLVRMVGGNYSEVTYGSPTVDGLIIVSSVQEAGGPFITWNIQASFWSMDSRYHGRIATAGDSGQVLIQTSELDPSCRL